MKVNDDIKTIVVLGMHRSGTSLVAGILERLGVNMGKKQIGIHWSNPLGHYENVDFVKMDDKILYKAGGTWDDPPEISKILELRNDDLLMEEIERTVKRNEEELWGWKVPTTTLTIWLYHPFLVNPYYIICYRNPTSIVASLIKRDGISKEHAERLLKIYNYSLEKFIEFNASSSSKVFRIDYETILENPADSVNRIVKFLDINPSKKKIKEAVEFVLPREKVEELQQKLKKKEIWYLLVDMVKNPYLVRRYLPRVLKNPRYALKKVGLK